MPNPFTALSILAHLGWVLLVPVICGSAYSILCVITAIIFRRRAAPVPDLPAGGWPALTLLKPVHGLEKELEENLRSACMQDYPDFQVVLSVQHPDDAAVPLLEKVQREFGKERVTLAIENFRAGTNGKINNMLGGLRHARHNTLVISDSDVRLRPDYLKFIVAPLGNPGVGCVCTLYKAARADAWYEKMELLTLNTDLVPSFVFAWVTGASRFCVGASTAVERTTLDEIGGLEDLADYLVEDYEMGRRIWSSGKEVPILPYFVDTIIDLKSASQWWDHQVYWDQNHRAAKPFPYFSTVLIRAIPFALLIAAARLFDPLGLYLLAAAVAVRLVCAAAILRWGIGDREGLRCLYLLPFRDLAGFYSWLLAYTKRTTIWRGNRFIVTGDGRLVAPEDGA